MQTAWIHTSVSRFSSRPVCLSVFLIDLFSTIVALIDSGATINFINERIVASLGLETEPYAPTRIVLVDGRTLAHSNRQVTLRFSIAGVIQMQTFLVAPIDVHSIILGMPWLEYTNPTIDWRLKTVQLGSNVISSSSPSQSSNIQEPETPETPETLPAKPEITIPQRIKRKRNPRHLPNEKPPYVPLKVRLTTKINSNDEIYVLHLDEIACLFKYLSAIHEVAQANPPNRGPLDHHIHLEEGSKPVFSPIYNLSETELQVLKEHIDENL